MKFYTSLWSFGRTVVAWCCLATFFDVALARVSRTFPCPKACLCDLITLKVDCSGGGLDGLPSTVPLNTRILLFQENNLGNELTIPVFNITAMVRLRQLSVANNSLSFIDSAVFPKQIKLIKLNFDSNYLEGIPAMVRNMRLLKHLHLSRNRISSINKNDLPPSSTIEKLYLDSNQIYILEDGAFAGQKRLEILYMADNLISNISTGLFSKLSMIMQLDLSYNNIGADFKTQYDFLNDDIPTPKTGEVGVSSHSGLGPPLNFSEWFTPNVAPKLEYLNLEANDIQTIAQNAFKLFPVLTSINLAYNQLIALPPQVLHTLSNLQILDLSGNRLRELPYELFQKNTRLEVIKLNKNLFVNLPENIFVGVEKSLLELDLSGNNLFSVSWMNVDLRHLIVLDLSANALTDAGSLTHIVSLQRLYLQENQLFDIPNVRNLTRLQELHLTNNSIRTISFDAFNGNVALELIALDYNELVTLAMEPFEGIPFLQTVKAAGNPFNCDCKMKWMAKFAEDTMSYDLYLNGIYADEMGIPESTFVALEAWIAPLKQQVVCVRPLLVQGVDINTALYNFGPDLICSHFANPRSIMVLILTWFLIIIVFLILFWGKTFWMARKQFGSSRPKLGQEKPKDDDTCYVISAVSKKAGNGQYHLLPDKSDNEPLVFLSNHDDEACKLRTFERSSTEIFIETTV
nr:platelet glycoprotein V-like [Lytechinus pictus]